jgi:hypothetical protein
MFSFKAELCRGMAQPISNVKPVIRVASRHQNHNLTCFKARYGTINHLINIACYELQSRYICCFRVTTRDVNETLGPETETRPRQLAFYPRQDPPKLFQDCDETETFDLGLDTRPRHSDAETETFFFETLPSDR